jgi:hypothetical protein
MKNLLYLFTLLFITITGQSQNVGIGTTTPAFKLDVKNGSINTDSVYRIGAITILAMPGPGTGNLFIGEDAGRINTGFHNTFSGNLAGLSNTTGTSNSFFGQTAGYVNTTGDHNSFFGRSTGSGNTTGSSNSFYGRSAAYANTSGNYNTAIGNSSLTSNITGTLNTALGYNANVNTDALNNATAVGAKARVDCDNCLVLGSVNGINGATSGVNVGIGTTNPNTSAQLDLSSTNKGFLPPRMTRTQIIAVSNPAEGLIIYNTTAKKPCYYNGIAWQTFDGIYIYEIGDNYQGGIIAYIFQLGDGNYIPGQFHGLIAAASDQSSAAEWGCSGTEIAGADGVALGTGNQNTIDIMAGCATAGIAARICGDLVLNGYSDWFLPSRDELFKLYFYRVAIGGFSNSNYWSSSEIFTDGARYINFENGNLVTGFKYSTYYVRAIRAF